MPVTRLVWELSELIDAVLRDIWTLHLGDAPDAALVAVGGYGRRELHPGSDIDILILIAAEPGPPLLDAVERLMTLLWDTKLDVGHSVRTVADCVREAQADVTVMTNLLEARWLTGSQTLFQQMRAATAPDQLWDSAQFFSPKRMNNAPAG